jgi:hypothetical protein
MVLKNLEGEEKDWGCLRCSNGGREMDDIDRRVLNGAAEVFLGAHSIDDRWGG